MKFSDVSEGVFNLKCWDCEIFNCTFSSMLESQSFLHILGKQLYLKDFSAENQSSCFFQVIKYILHKESVLQVSVCGRVQTYDVAARYTKREGNDLQNWVYLKNLSFI